VKFPLSKYIWFDGKLVPVNMAKVPVTTHAIHYGTSIFEGIRAYWNSKNLYVFRLKDHIKRFRNSGQFYNIALNFSDKQIENAVINLCKKNKIRKSCYIRAFYFVGQYGINLHVTKKHQHMQLSLLFHSAIYLIKMVLLQQFRNGENLVICQHLHRQRWAVII